MFALPDFVEHAQVVEAGQRVGLRQILDAFARLGDVRRQRGGEVGDQKERRQLSDGLAGIKQRNHIEARSGDGEQQVAQGDGRHLQQE